MTYKDSLAELHYLLDQAETFGQIPKPSELRILIAALERLEHIATSLDRIAFTLEARETQIARR